MTRFRLHIVAFSVAFLAGAVGVWVAYHSTGAGRSILGPVVAALGGDVEEAPPPVAEAAPPTPAPEPPARPVVPPPVPEAPPPVEPHPEPERPEQPPAPVRPDPARFAEQVRAILDEAEAKGEAGAYAESLGALGRLVEDQVPCLPDDERRATELADRYTPYFKLVVEIERIPDPPGELVLIPRKSGGQLVGGLLETTPTDYVVSPWGVRGSSRIHAPRHAYGEPRPLGGADREAWFRGEVERRIRDASSAHDFYLAIVRAVEYGVPHLVPSIVGSALEYQRHEPDQDFWSIALKEKAYVLARRHLVYEATEDGAKAARCRDLLVRYFHDTEFGRDLAAAPAVEPRPPAASGPDPDPATDRPEPEPASPQAKPQQPTPTDDASLQDVLAGADRLYDAAYAELRRSLPGMEDCDAHLKKALEGFEKALALYEQAFEQNPGNEVLAARLEKCRDLRAHCHKFQRM